MNNELSTIQSKLINAQALNGGWPWFKGMADDEYITTHVIEGLLELQKLGALNLNDNSELSESINKGISYLATRQKEAYQNILKNKNAYKEYIPSRNELIRLLIFSRTADYRSHLKKEDSQYFLSQASKYWLKLSLDEKVILAKVLHSTDSNKFTEIVNSFKDNAIKNSKIGWYWKENLRSGYYVNSDIELHAEMLELFSSYQRDDKMIKQLSKWLLLNKHSNKWDNTKASTKAIYSLLMSSNDLNAGVKATIRMGSKKILVDEQNAESGSGYYKESIALAVIKPDMAKVRIEKANNSVAYGAVYWKYLEEMDKLEPKGGFLKINKTYFIKAINKGVQEYVPVTNSVIKTGDEILVRVFITNDRDMEYVYLKDMRPSGLEPVDVVSKSQYQKGIWYYQSTRDAATDFFLHFLPKGEHELTYKLKVNNAGSFESGVSSIQCMYAPEFSGNSKSTKIKVVE
jgi:uncharacterized protein YfaS (alpha-2-macroglobulin family)